MELQRLKNKFDIIGNDPGLNRALEMAVAVAPTDLTVMVTGESGTGKDVIPRIIHQHSLRKTGKYLAVNCAAIPSGTVDSELFGHEKGSFTGAIEARKGYFEEADGGTLFLDEIGELPLPTQAKLLRVLQSGEYIRVGASKVCKTNVRVIAATNVDLLNAVAQGKFRQDLYYRLSAVQIAMPPLRDRKEDIHLLFRKFTSDFSEKYSRRKVNLTRDAVDFLTSYRWPGNIRQLQSIANRVSVFETVDLRPDADRIEIDAATLAKYITKEDDSMLPVHVGSQAGSMREEDKQEIYRAIALLNAEVARLRNLVEGHQAPPQRPELPDDVDVQEDFQPQPQAPVEEPEEQPGHIVDYTAEGKETSFSIADASEDLIRKALEKHHGNRKKAAEELGISERTLYRKLPPEFRSPRLLLLDLFLQRDVHPAGCQNGDHQLL